MSYRLHIKSSAEREMARLPKPIRERIDLRIHELTEEPRPDGAIKLAGHSDLYRVREGDYRIVYVVEDEKLIVLVVRVAHRKDVYRGF